MTVPEYTFRPMTRLAMVIDRITAETGHSAAAILAHIGTCDYRNRLVAVCERFMFDGSAEIHWSLNSAWLMQDIGHDVPCYECKAPCRLAGKRTESC